ncbi:MAG: M20/M25/M40 family metallo-hydrolase [Clostridiales bacterium]|nr:M20/M25/M40 family metallo-hydrolase [Clostridiales bacterium]
MILKLIVLLLLAVLVLVFLRAFAGLAVFALLACLAVAVVRALMMKPTAAKTATPPVCDASRAKVYGEKLSAMVKIETVSSRFDPDREKFRAFQQSLRALFPRVYAACEEYHPGDGLVLYLKSENPKGEPILLMSHHDVVEAKVEGWDHAPFSGDIDEQGRVWGRGTVDTKGSLMCELQALEELLEKGWKPETDVYITSSCTEEWSGPCATAIVDWLKARNVRLGMLLDEGGMILQEPVGGVKGRYAMVGVLEKGYGDVRFTARSHGGHASAPKKNSPLPRLGALMHDIDANSPFKAQITPTVREMFTRLAPNSSFALKLVFGNLWLFGPLLKKAMPMISPAAAAMMQTTCAFTTAKGSEGLNVLPTAASVTANLRFIHHQANEECLELLARRAKKHGVEMEVITQEQPCPIVDYTAKPFGLLEKVTAEIYPGYGVVPYVMTGGTDAKYYGDVCEHCLRFAPIEINNQQYGSIHSVNENLHAAALVPAVDFYKRVLVRYCANDL